MKSTTRPVKRLKKKLKIFVPPSKKQLKETGNPSTFNKGSRRFESFKSARNFIKIPSEDCELLGLDPISGGRPELFLWTHIPVPPACIRPSVAMTLEGGSNEDDLTIKLSEIVYTNFIIKDALEKCHCTNVNGRLGFLTTSMCHVH